ncbi:GIY-YIG nuclease family protein [Thalassolituus sp.]|uniref:GIY-YIG nuclease family protein n=1 Tax=Thalassolituus sp. TaxID=2030822 RepID=UPI0035129A33
MLGIRRFVSRAIAELLMVALTHRIVCDWENKECLTVEACVYILASQKNGTLYIGVTSNLPQRVWQHKNGQADGFTKKYAIHRLVYFEQTSDIESAIAREKQLKKWRRQWKIDLIEGRNPDWVDLYPDIVG